MKYWLPPGVDDDLAGSEINLQAKYKLAEGTTLVAGYGYGIPGGNQDDHASLHGCPRLMDRTGAFLMFNTNF